MTRRRPGLGHSGWPGTCSTETRARSWPRHLSGSSIRERQAALVRHRSARQARWSTRGRLSFSSKARCSSRPALYAGTSMAAAGRRSRSLSTRRQTAPPVARTVKSHAASCGCQCGRSLIRSQRSGNYSARLALHGTGTRRAVLSTSTPRPVRSAWPEASTSSFATDCSSVTGWPSRRFPSTESTCARNLPCDCWHTWMTGQAASARRILLRRSSQAYRQFQKAQLAYATQRRA